VDLAYMVRSCMISFSSWAARMRGSDMVEQGFRKKVFPPRIGKRWKAVILVRSFEYATRVLIH
jgi:hypothetical protein